MEFKINIDEAVRYMGYRQPPAAQQLGIIREIAGLLEKQLEPAYVFRCFKTENVSGGIRLVGSGVTLRGNSIREHLTGCDSAVLLCATVSSKADELIRAKETEDIALGFMTDCLASAAVEAVCDAAEAQIAERLSDKYLTWRFSPGYGDLPIEIQPSIINALEAGKRAGVCCTDSFMLIPRKSVTAVIGVSDKPVPRANRGCAGCAAADNCDFRKRGIHCGN